MTTRSTELVLPIPLPWGQGAPLLLQPPDPWELADVAWPDLSNPLADYPASLAQAIDEPVGGLSIESIVRAGSTVAIVVDDPSRWTPVREALPVVADRLLRLGLRPEEHHDQRRRRSSPRRGRGFDA